MTVKEFIDFINKHNPRSLDDVDDITCDVIDPVKESIEGVNFDDYSKASNIYKLDDGYVEVRGVNQVFDERVWVSDLDIPCIAREVEPYEVTVTKYKVK